MESRLGKRLALSYQKNGVNFRQQLSWPQVEERITALIRQDAYLTGEEKAELETLAKLHFIKEEQPEAAIPSVQSENSQITLFDYQPQRDIYEDTGGGDNDHLLDRNTVRPAQPLFQEGSLIYFRGQVYEVLKFLHDGHTVEIGDIYQLQNLAGFKIRERVPLIGNRRLQAAERQLH